MILCYKNHICGMKCKLYQASSVNVNIREINWYAGWTKNAWSNLRNMHLHRNTKNILKTEAFWSVLSELRPAEY